MMKISIESKKLNETFNFMAPDDGGYIRVSDSQTEGEYPQIFTDEGASISAYSEQELKAKAKSYVRRAERIGR